MHGGRGQCEVCGGSIGGVARLDLGSRAIVLCREHAERARIAEADSPEALHALFVEADGRRALLDRRAPEERRLFPPRPEGRRHDAGRRQSD